MCRPFAEGYREKIPPAEKASKIIFKGYTSHRNDKGKSSNDSQGWRKKEKIPFGLDSRK